MTVGESIDELRTLIRGLKVNPACDAANLVLHFFGVRLVPLSWFDRTAEILAENTRLRAIVDSMRPVVVRHVHKWDVN